MAFRAHRRDRLVFRILAAAGLAATARAGIAAALSVGFRGTLELIVERIELRHLFLQGFLIFLADFLLDRNRVDPGFQGSNLLTEQLVRIEQGPAQRLVAADFIDRRLYFA